MSEAFRLETVFTRLKELNEQMPDDDSFQWNCRMVQAVRENKPFQVLQLAGSHNFTNELQKDIALSLVQYACEMITDETTKNEASEVETANLTVSSPESGSELTSSPESSEKEDGQDEPKPVGIMRKFNLKHNARQQLIRRYNKTKATEISDETINAYSKRYCEPAEELIRYYKEIPYLPHRAPRRNRCTGTRRHTED
ncbi:hypothetical protein L5515_007356 [Caenorhabditis briggsae]|uniref:Uncharacterized protein n=1 Tax=Caenorhabditis briggsae TaxID=6238 RepID=A0AAE9EY78_CAEBR|nr:hypothetical protein L5515_007356 [Caenorhabditis briggsae]